MSCSLQILLFCNLDLLRDSFTISCVNPWPRAPTRMIMGGTGASTAVLPSRLRQISGPLILFVRSSAPTDVLICVGPPVLPICWRRMLHKRLFAQGR